MSPPIILSQHSGFVVPLIEILKQLETNFLEDKNQRFIALDKKKKKTFFLATKIVFFFEHEKQRGWNHLPKNFFMNIKTQNAWNVLAS